MYYVTLCIQDRKEIFGEIQNGAMRLSSVGKMVNDAWVDLERYDRRIFLDEHIVMPNHLHGIIGIDWFPHFGRPRGAAPTLSLPDLMNRFKSWTTRQYFDGVKSNNWPVMRQRLWQRNYYEHIIRNEEDLNRIREYIRANPQNWGIDPENLDS